MALLGRVPNSGAQIILSLAIMLMAGFLGTRLTKLLHLPNVTGYLLAGIAIGPWALHLIPDGVFARMDFVTDAALAFIAFGVGKYFKLSELRKSGPGIFVITLLESLTAGVLVTLMLYFVFRFSLAFSLLLGAIGCATAPASTIMTIRQYKARGEFVNTILQVVALDDAVALVAFSICAAYVGATEGSGRVEMALMVAPVVYNLLGIAAGAVTGFVMHLIVDPPTRSADHRLALVTALILALSGLCVCFDISPLLSCMVMGTVYINAGGNKKTFKLVTRFTPPVLLLFFVLSGMRLSLPALRSAGLVGVAYFLIRILGKYIGAWAGCWLARTPVATRRFLGLALIPQAGVSIGLAVLGQRMLPGPTGELLATIILSSGVLYEMIGPACARASLFLSGTLQRDAQPALAAAAAAPAAKPAREAKGDRQEKAPREAKNNRQEKGQPAGPPRAEKEKPQKPQKQPKGAAQSAPKAGKRAKGVKAQSK